VTAAKDVPTLAPPAPPVAGRKALWAWYTQTIIDSGFLRAPLCNRYRVGDQVWRSGQPGWGHIRWAKRKGVRTVVNLRGRRDNCGSYLVERDACAHFGLTLINFPCRSRGMPEKTTLHAAAQLFGRIEYPALFHCKSGADRAGFLSALYLHLHERRPLAEALRQLHWRFGHVRQAKTGMLDAFLGQYGEDTGGLDPDRFLPWVDAVYDPVAFADAFQESRAGSFLVDRILRRE